MKKLIFLFLSLFLVFTSSNAFGLTYQSKVVWEMNDAEFQMWAEGLISTTDDLTKLTPLCSSSEYNFTWPITSVEIYKIQNCGKKIASKIISINNTAITNTNNYRKQTRNDYFSWALSKRLTNFQSIRNILPILYLKLSDTSLYFNFKPLLKISPETVAYWKYNSLLNANSSVTWSLANIYSKLKDFNTKKIDLYNSDYDAGSDKYGIKTSSSIDIDLSSINEYKNDVNASLSQLSSELLKYNSWSTNKYLFESEGNFNTYMAYLSWSINDSMNSQIKELNTAIRYKILSESLYPSNESLLYLVRQLNNIQTYVNQNSNVGNRWIIFKNIISGIDLWFTTTTTYYNNKETIFPISSSTYEISPNLTNDKKKFLKNFIKNNLRTDYTWDGTSRVNEFVFLTAWLKKLATDNTVITFTSDKIGGTANSLSSTFNWIKKISKSFVKSGSRYITTNLN